MHLFPMTQHRRMAGCLFGGTKALVSSGFHVALSGVYACLDVSIHITL